MGMMKFVSGTATHQMDAKYRTRIPAKYRNAFPDNETLHFVQYSTGCIAIMCTSVMEKNLLSFGNIDPADEEAMQAKRFLYSRVEDVVEDTQKRFMIPKSMRDYAGLKKNLITVGMGDYIEIWEEENYLKAMADMSVAQANRVTTAYRTKTGT